MTKSVGSLEQLLLFAAVRLGEAAYGRAIRHEVESATGRTVSHGALYATMDRLQRQGLVTSELSEHTPARGGRRRRIYRLTPEGARALREGYEGLRRLAEVGLEDLAALERSSG